MDKSKFGVVKLENVIEIFSKSGKDYNLVLNDPSIMEKAYESVKLCQLNSQADLTKMEFDYLIVYLR